METNTMRKRKIAVLGSRSVGKSSLVIQFIENHFVEAYYPTIKSTFSKGVVYQGVEYDCNIIDSAGLDEYSILNSMHAIGIHGYVLVYSVTSRRSFEMVKIVYDKILDFCGKNDIPCVIVGAKTDLQSSRQVQPDEGEELAKSNRAAWVETSAKNNTDVGKVFELCLAEIEKRSLHSRADQPEGGKCAIILEADVIDVHRKLDPNDLTDQVTRDSNEPIASGGFADIYRGTMQKNGDTIVVAVKAIKTYSVEVEGDFAKKKKRLRREIKVWFNLQHANVLPLLGTTKGFGRFPAMVCPWVGNGILTVYLEDRYAGLTEIDLLNLLYGVSSGLHYLHSHSVVHGDLTGSNVLIRNDGGAYIADFGLSMLLNQLGGSTFATSSFQARGTLRWMAPELLDLDVPEDGMEEELSRVVPTTQSDVYSFGGVMLQILTGKVPYHYYTREGQIVHAISKGVTPRRPSSALVTERRWVFLRRCWSIISEPLSRPSSEEIVEFTEEEIASASTL